MPFNALILPLMQLCSISSAAQRGQRNGRGQPTSIYYCLQDPSIIRTGESMALQQQRDSNPCNTRTVWHKVKEKGRGRDWLLSGNDCFCSPLTFCCPLKTSYYLLTLKVQHSLPSTFTLYTYSTAVIIYPHIPVWNLPICCENTHTHLVSYLYLLVKTSLMGNNWTFLL